MRRVVAALLVLVLVGVLGPPLYFAVAGGERPDLPPADDRVALPDGRRIHVLDAGQGPVVVLVHGLPGSAYDWEPTTEALVARGLRVIAVDRAGFGHSDPRVSEDEYTYPANGRDLVALLEALDLEGATVVGWSYGGGTAIHAARQDPSRMHGLVLVASAGPLPPGDEAPGPPPLFELLFSGPVMAWVRAVPPVGEAMRRAISEQAFSEQSIPDWWHTRLAANLGRPATRDAWLAEGRNAPPPWDDLDPSDLTVPILVIHGSDDRFVPLRVGELLAERAPRASLVRVEGGSHMLPVTHPELLVREVEAFVGEG